MQQGAERDSDQDHLLPYAIINRLVRDALPGDAKSSQAAKLCVQECASEFIGFVVDEANSITNVRAVTCEDMVAWS